jgi:Ca2+-binding RTX toxin-like protein
MVLQIDGKPAWTITGISADGTTLTLDGPQLTAAAFPAGQQHIADIVTGFAPSPLVIFGSTSQDGIWYSGNPSVDTQRDFGSKPYPIVLGNGSTDFIFPVADPFNYAGNNVINASADFANVPEGQLPSVGLVIYGGPGNSTIYGSQASDYIAGGSGNNTIYGGRGDNQLLGNDGLNVDVITRAISFPTVNGSSYPNADPLTCAPSSCNDVIYGDGSGTGIAPSVQPTDIYGSPIYGDGPTAGELTTDQFGDYNNLIFGAD